MTAGDSARRFVILMHHADALGADADPARPLSALGRAQAEWLARRAQADRVRPQAIWHSGKLRARQTAEALLRFCNPGATFKLMRGLRPEDSPEWIRDLLVVEDQDVAVVSHMPLVPALLEALTQGSREFPLNGMVLLERTGSRTFHERWRVAPPRELQY
jgi:phosphohistidine phosphatase